MTEGSMKGAEKEEYVEVIHTYSYQRDDRTHSMCKGEVLMLLKRANGDWWQVIREGDKRPFYAPAQYVRVTSITPEKMKQLVKQSRLSQKPPPNPQSIDENVPTCRPQSLPISPHDKSTYNAAEVSSPTQSMAGHTYVKIDNNRNPIERNPYTSRPAGISSFKSESPHVPTKGLPPRSGSNELVSPTAYSRGFTQGSQESSSSHTSRSSLNDGSRCSTESLTHPHVKKHVMKAASHDELSSGDRCRSSLDVSKPRAASSEELDGRYSGKDNLFRSNQLSYRHRSNSVDFKIFQKDLNLSEFKQGSLDKSRKQRISKDPTSRRRSWAVEETRVAENYRSSLKKGETQDVSIVLDVPPKLPPKLRKHRQPDIFSSSSENIRRLEGPIDVRVQEINSSKPALPLTVPNAKRLSQDYDKGHSRLLSEPFTSSDIQRRSMIVRQDAQDSKETPVALPRKILPDRTPPDLHTRDNNGNQVKKQEMESSDTFEQGSFQDKVYSDNDEKQRFITSDSYGKIPGTPDLLRKMDRTPDAPQDNWRIRGNCDPLSNSAGKIGEHLREEEKENDKFPPRETPTPDSSRGTRNCFQFPPSPKVSPNRLMFDDWGEYYDESIRRQFYYNSRTREKRWKPPRKVIPSVSIPEGSSFGRGDRSDYGRDQPRSPPPDYPSSPKSTHRAWQNSQFEADLPPPSSRSSTLSPSPNRFLHHPSASSQTLPANNSSSLNKSFSSHSHLSSMGLPPAPPACAKPPHVPATPTSPNIPSFSELSEAEALLDVVGNLSPPKGWEKKLDAFNQRVYFYNRGTGERWLATSAEDGKIYYYEEGGTKSQWKLPETDDIEDSRDGNDTLNRPTSPIESLRISLLAENLSEFSKNIEKEGFLHRTFLMREGKKCRKNWTQSYVRYIIGQFNNGASGLLYFSKTKDEDKKAEIFEFFDTCQLEHTNDKKTSRQQVLGLRNGRGTEVLLQFDDKDIADEWFKVLYHQEGIQYMPSQDDRKSKRGSDKVKREPNVDNLNPDNKGITDKLRNFIKRRPLKETLEKKGIYKEAIFGSTLAELAFQDKTGTPIFVLQCINHIEKSVENLSTDGLYRISGNAAQIQKIRYEVAQRNYTILSREKDVHNLSGSLKLFFRELKEPLIPFLNYSDFIQATEYRRNNQQTEKLNKAVRKLPSENYETLKVLLQHLLRVTEYEKENRMSISNLAIVFGPCLLWPKETTSNDLMTDVMLHNRVIEGLLTDFPKIFVK